MLGMFMPYDGDINYSELLAYIDAYIKDLEDKERNMKPPLSMEATITLRHQMQGVELFKRQLMLDRQRYEYSMEHASDFEGDGDDA